MPVGPAVQSCAPDTASTASKVHVLPVVAPVRQPVPPPAMAPAHPPPQPLPVVRPMPPPVTPADQVRTASSAPGAPLRSSTTIARSSPPPSPSYEGTKRPRVGGKGVPLPEPPAVESDSEPLFESEDEDDNDQDGGGDDSSVERMVAGGEDELVSEEQKDAPAAKRGKKEKEPKKFKQTKLAPKGAKKPPKAWWILAGNATLTAVGVVTDCPDNHRDASPTPLLHRAEDDLTRALFANVEEQRKALPLRFVMDMVPRLDRIRKAPPGQYKKYKSKIIKVAKAGVKFSEAAEAYMTEYAELEQFCRPGAAEKHS